MKTFLRRFPDVAAVAVFFLPIGLWANLSGRGLPESAWLYVLLLAIWMRLVRIDWAAEDSRGADRAGTR
ncbi:MAG TPA: hypothetical protein VN648_03835 [Candidatus Methylomirabilis sp.]|nr:hypothetical protein [Candidatus Methylomirabilis sp.]